MGALDGRTALITGAGSGIGRAIAVSLAGAGAAVVLAGRTVDSLEETARIVDASERALIVPCDVAQADQVTRLVAATRDRFGRLDILVNNAGTNIPGRALASLSMADWDLLIRANLDGAFYCVHAVLPLMRAQGCGLLIQIGSLSVRRPSPLAGAAYVASKAGLTALSAVINAEERRHGIRSSVITLGDTDTAILDRRPAPPSADLRAAILQPEDVAACALLIATLPPRAGIDELVLTATAIN